MIGRSSVAILAGALVVFALALFGGALTGPRITAHLAERAQAAINDAGGRPVKAVFTGGLWASRYPVLTGGEGLGEATRARVARAVAQVPGMGGIRWSDGTARATGGNAEAPPPLHCQDDVDALLRARTIRFEESSTRIDAASNDLIDEVADALRPCLGSIIALTGHTDSSGTEPGNLELSQQRAEAVRQALVQRGIPADGLRTRGVGSSEPVEGLDPSDPANRRIEFSVVAKVATHPTPVDTPGPR
jgi:OOP family OmpA-OmpF porin